MLLGISEEELYTLWLADRLYGVIKNEPAGLKSIALIQTLMKKKVKNKVLKHSV